MATHLASLGSGWHVWKTMVLRGAGFSVRSVSGLSTSEVARAADTGDVDRVRDALAASTTRDATVLREHAVDARFREALLWQNPTFLKFAADGLLRQSLEDNGSTARQRKLGVANYLQRYATKCDTIGFFGPIGWAQFGDESSQVIGRELLRSREIYFEHWGIELVAARLSEDPALKPWLAPRRMPTVFLEGDVLHHPVGKTTELPPAYAAIVRACDGMRTAREIAIMLVAVPELELGSIEEVFEQLDELVASSVVTWAIEIPSSGHHPMRAVVAALERAEPSAAAPGRAVVATLERCRAALADRDRLEQGLDELGETMTSITGASSSRAEGQSSAGRTLVFEDCCRDHDLVLGADHLARLGAPLALVLDSARWLTAEIAAAFGAEFDRVYDELDVDGQVDYIQFWQRVEPLFGGDRNTLVPLVARAAEGMQARWLALLGGPFPPDQSSVVKSTAELRESVDRDFAAAGPGWPSARHHSPDVMLVAPGFAEVRAGALQYVLGELHPSLNTLVQFVHQHPAPGDLTAWMNHDISVPHVAPVLPRMNRGHVSISDVAVELETGRGRSSKPPDRVIGVGALVVSRTEGGLEIRSRDGAHRFDMMSFFDHFLSFETSGAFHLLAEAAHTPRVTIDSLIVQRETWVIPASDVAFAKAKTPEQRFVRAREFAKAHRMPRFCFFKIPEEPKPCFLDFESAIYVEIFAKQLRQAKTTVRIAEMLPTLEQCWLADAEDQRYVSELRIVAVDDRPYSPRM